MKIVNRLHQALNTCLFRTAKAFGISKLPTCFNGKWFWVSTRAWTGLRRVYEPEVARALRSALKPGDHFWDVGAHFGLWSLYADKIVGRNGAVTAFEPSPSFDVLNSLTSKRKRIRALKVGVGASDGRATFFAQGTSTSGSFERSVVDINVPYQKAVPVSAQVVDVFRLDSLAKKLGATPRVIKVDVEGFEFEVLKGARELLTRGDTTWIIELHPLQMEVHGTSSDKIKAYLGDLGYTIETVDIRPGQPETILARR